jgi:hypothetical protein
MNPNNGFSHRQLGKVIMKKLLIGLLSLSVLISACAPQQLEEIVDRDNLEVFVSEGESILTTIAGRDVSIVLDPNQDTDTNEVVVTLVNLGTAYLVETADPAGRYLPSVQLVQRSGETLQQITVPQIKVNAGWALRFISHPNVQMLKGRLLGSIPLDQLNAFLAPKVYGRGMNIILQVPQTLEEFQQINIYRTPGTMTFFVAGGDIEGLGGGSLLSVVQPGEVKLAAVSLLAESLATIEPTLLVEKAQTLQGGIFVANADSAVPLPNTGAEETPVPFPECAEDEVLIVVEQDGQPVGECQEAPWLDQTPVPTATIEPTPVGPSPTPTLPPPTATPTPLPVIYTETFTDVNPMILGDCPAWYYRTYRAFKLK